jgi:hypothetical protein
MAMPRRSHQTESFDRLNRGVRAGEEDAVIGPDGERQAALAK